MQPTVAILISGRGSNMQALVEACESGALNATVTHVISNDPDAAGLKFAENRHIPTHILQHTKFSSRAQFDAALQNLLADLQPNWIVLAGFMRILGAKIVAAYEGQIINVHPSLLPKYPGLNTHERALNALECWSGASVHFVTDALDAGPIIAQSRVPIIKNDTPVTLAKRVLATEHALIVHSLQLCVNKRARYADGQCYFD